MLLSMVSPKNSKLKGRRKNTGFTKITPIKKKSSLTLLSNSKQALTKEFSITSLCGCVSHTCLLVLCFIFFYCQKKGKQNKNKTKQKC